MLERAWQRRRFLQRMGCGFGGLALQAMLAEDGFGAVRRPPVVVDPVEPHAPRPPVFRPRAKSVIFLFLVGGPSHIDTFDYKPVLDRLDGQKVPDSLRKPVEGTRFANVFTGAEDRILKSPWKFRQFGETGTWVSGLFPHVARHVDDLCMIHSMQADSNNHGPASIQFHTGDTTGGKASIGSWVTYGLGSENRNLPSYVLLFDAGPLGGATNYSNGFLPAAFQGTRLRDTGPPVADLLPPEEFAAGQRQSLDTLRALNLWHRESRPGWTQLDARIASYELAWRMQSAALEVGDLDSEPESIRRSYGLDHPNRETAKYGRKLLLARRLVERGVRFVQVYDMHEKDGWDAHGNLKGNHESHARVVDQPIAALLADLKQSGLLDSTLVICGSEFGRTPMVQGSDGRQHNCAGFTVWLAGGGTVPGARIGSTDEIGLMAAARPTPFRDLHATILAALGLNHEDLWFETSGRLERLTGVQNTASIIPGVLA